MSEDSVKQGLPPDLPVLTEVVSGDELPILTDIVAPPLEELPSFKQEPAVVAAPPPPAEETEEVPLQLSPQLEEHVESLFMQRLLPRLEEAQRQAIALTLAELKEELPQLIRDALPPRT